MGLTSEIPDHVWAFDLPGVPNFIGTHVIFAVVPRDMETFDDLFLFDRLDGGIDVIFAEHGHHVPHCLDEQFLLVGAQLGAIQSP